MDVLKSSCRVTEEEISRYYSHPHISTALPLTLSTGVEPLLQLVDLHPHTIIMKVRILNFSAKLA